MEKIIRLLDFYDVSGIYALHNRVSDKWYIGQSKGSSRSRGIGGRLNRHLWLLESGIHPNSHLQRSFNRHGRDSFDLYCMERCDDEMLTGREQYHIDSYKGKLFNLCLIAGTMKGKKWNDERRQRQSGENHFFYGKKHTDESKKKISKSRTGVTAGKLHHLYGVGHSQESREKMSASHKLLVGDKNPFFGKKHSDETKKLNSEKKKKWLAENGHPTCRKPPKSGTFKGVKQVNDGKFMASIKISGTVVVLGLFDNAEDAAKIYDFYVINQNWTKAYLNFPEFDYSNFVAGE